MEALVTSSWHYGSTGSPDSIVVEDRGDVTRMSLYTRIVEAKFHQAKHWIRASTILIRAPKGE